MDALKSYYEISPFFFTITASASLLFFISNLSMIFGGEFADDVDLIGEHIPSDVAFKFFSTQTVLAFFMGFGWAGITATVKWELIFLFAIGVAVAFGLILMSFSAFLMFQINKLNHTSKVSIYSSLGMKGMVYTDIPEGEAAIGKVQVVVSGQQKIVSAVSNGEKIESFTEIEVIGIKDKSTIIVRRRNT